MFREDALMVKFGLQVKTTLTFLRITKEKKKILALLPLFISDESSERRPAAPLCLRSVTLRASCPEPQQNAQDGVASPKQTPHYQLVDVSSLRKTVCEITRCCCCGLRKVVALEFSVFLKGHEPNQPRSERHLDGGVFILAAAGPL